MPFVLESRESSIMLLTAHVAGARRTLLFWILVLLLLPCALRAQSAPVQFLGAPASAFTGISFPIGMAADTQANVYIADYSSNAVYKETLQPNGSYVRSTIASNFAAGPVGLAIDTAGNVYLGLNTSSGVIKETLQSNGSYVQSVISSSSFFEVYGLAVDSSGNVYVGSYGSRNVYKLIPSGNSYSQTTIYNSGSNPVAGVALDSSGNVFAVRGYSNTIYKLTPSGNPATTTTYTASSITIGASSAFGVAVDAAGDLFIADNSGYLRLETPDGSGGYQETVLASGLSQSYGVTFSPAGVIYFGRAGEVDSFQPAAVNLGSRAIDTTSAAITLTYTVQSGAVVSAINVAAQQTGAADFVTASGGTCPVQTYSVV